MAPLADKTTFEPILAPSASEQSPQSTTEVNGNGATPSQPTPTQTALQNMPTEAPTHEQKDYHDILSYEDKWVGWDGPVWCKRYGRFENKEHAAEDDGYKPSSDAVPQKLGTHYQIHQCQRQGCACRVPFEHRSYVKDIQRRIEPMTASLVALEHQVGNLVHHIVKDGEHALHDAFRNKDGKDRFAVHTVSGKQADGPMHSEHFENHHKSMAEIIANLEGQVHSLTHQLHVLVKQNDELIRNGHAGPGEHHYWQVPQ